ncbi:MAG: ABC transporter permease [Acidaminococcaceae bacterium]|nr:ABC transporter permease [Acidaminococcaceae bacterium]MBR1661776.1 ABC transporter permease [Acidaminococcaceae bacterium]
MSKGLLQYLTSTVLRMVVLLIAVTMLSFFLVHNAPMDPVDAFLGEVTVSEEQRAQIAEHWGLNRSPVEQYLIWVNNTLHGDMGESLTFHEPVTKVLGERFRASLLLMGTAWILSGVLGMILGIIAGVYKDRWPDRIIKTFSLLLASTPVFWIGLLVLMVFAVELQWFPLGLAVPIGKVESDVTWLERLHHLVLPALTLSITGIANIVLHTRQKLIDVMDSEYVLFARARGESLKELVLRHGLRNIALPAVTLQFASISELFGGSVLAERVFSYPGLGSTAVVAGMHADAPLLLGIALFSALFVFAGNLTANILYGVIDPQIREGGGIDG